MQDKHLNELKDKKKAIEINLTNGLIINARIIGIDNFSIIVQYFLYVCIHSIILYIFHNFLCYMLYDVL